MLSRNVVSKRSTLLARALRVKSTQVQVEDVTFEGPIAADGRHEVNNSESYDGEMK